MYIVQRLKHWESKQDRESNPGWFNPKHLSIDDIRMMNRLLGSNNILRVETVVAAVRGGTIAFIVREESDLKPIVGFATMTIVHTLNDVRALVTQLRTLQHGSAPSDMLRSALDLTAREHGLATTYPRPRLRGEIEQAELFDELFAG